MSKKPSSPVASAPNSAPTYRLTYEQGGFVIVESVNGVEKKITEPEVWPITIRQIEVIMRKAAGL